MLTYFANKDEGGDCDKLFWDIEWLKVKDNTIIISTHHFQKRLDPITEWKKKIFTVSKNGRVQLTKHLIRKYVSTEWKEIEEYYKKQNEQQIKLPVIANSVYFN